MEIEEEKKRANDRVIKVNFTNLTRMCVCLCINGLILLHIILLILQFIWERKKH